MTYQPVDPDDTTAFGELIVGEPTPIVQLQFPYNINTDLVEKRENASGTVTESQSMAVIQSGSNQEVDVSIGWGELF